MATVNSPNKIKVPAYVAEGQAVLVSWGKADGAHDYVLQRSSKTGYETIYTGSGVFYMDKTHTAAEITYRVAARNDSGQDSKYIYSTEVIKVFLNLDYEQDGILRPFDMIVDFSSSNIDILPATRETVDTIAGVDGGVVLDIKYEPRLFDLVGRSKSNLTRHERDTKLADVSIMLNQLKRETKYLLYRDKLYGVRIGGKPDVITRPSYIEYQQLSLKAYDPFGYSIHQGVLCGSGVAENKGTEVVYPLIYIEGAYNNPSITINGTTYQLATTAVYEDDLTVIDTAQGIVTLISKGKAEPIVGAWYTEFPYFNVGKNTVEYSGNIRTVWRDKYINL